MPVVWVPSLMRDLTGGEEQVSVPGSTLRQVVASLEQAYPGMRDRLMDDDGIKPGIAVVIDGETALMGLLEPVSPDSEVHFLPAIGGGGVSPFKPYPSSQSTTPRARRSWTCSSE